jgi:REP element-mobilizing transposase RayT
VVGSVKSVVAHAAGQPIWQKGFHDHALRREADVVGIARYIVRNPVRAGIVMRPGLYPHWDSIWL